MSIEHWHTEFSPSKFLSRIDLARLIKRNEVYNSNFTDRATLPCILCTNTNSHGIVLTNKSFLCESCYTEIAAISYPEKYEKLRREFLISSEAHHLAWESFRGKFEFEETDSAFVFWGWTSLLLCFANPSFLYLSLILIVLGHSSNARSKNKFKAWQKRKAQWEGENHKPINPILKHFHDPTAELTLRDQRILKVFDHWPGYPPYWDYLRTLVLARDSFRCQVTGCPSRSTLHVHHRQSIGSGGAHTPNNLVSLCDFHHALEPADGHDKLWNELKTSYFTLVRRHTRHSTSTQKTYPVKAHLRRLELITQDELLDLSQTYGFSCPKCAEENISYFFDSKENTIRVTCPSCFYRIKGAHQLTEETGPRLAQLLMVKRNKGSWKARWDMLAERKNENWGHWAAIDSTAKRTGRKRQIETKKSSPLCPKCGAPTKLIKPRRNERWEAFWGCTMYPVTRCKGSVNNVFDLSSITAASSRSDHWTSGIKIKQE